MLTKVLAESCNYKLLRANEVHNTYTYCSVGCDSLMYSLGDGAKNATARIFHIKGDLDHPVSRGAFCPKGAGLLDYINSLNRLKYPQYRAPDPFAIASSKKKFPFSNLSSKYTYACCFISSRLSLCL